MEKSFLKIIETIDATLEKCPWIKEQTIDSLKDEPMKEAAELKQAIETKDVQNLKEEIGDLLYDTMLIASIAERDGLLKRKEVLDIINEKIRRRKPWCFGGKEVKTAEEAVKRWYEIKEEEKKNKLKKKN